MAIAKKSKSEKNPVVKKVVAKAKDVTPPAPSSGPVGPTAASASVTRAERDRRIAEASYFIALRKGFGSSDPEQNWIEAERQVDAELRARGIQVCG